MRERKENEFQMNAEEHKELYDIGAKMRRDVVEIPEVDIDKEWLRLQAGIKKSRRGYVMPLGWRHIAAAVAVVLFVGSVTATVVLNRRADVPIQEPLVTETVATASGVLVITPSDSVAEAVSEIKTLGKVYDEMALGRILTDIASVFDVTVECDQNLADYRLYLSIPAESTLPEVVALLDAFENISAELVNDSNGKSIIVVK